MQLANNGYKPRGFANALETAQDAAIIAEFKRGSPSLGVFQRSLDPVRTAIDFASAGASCISVLTDAKFFAGSLGFVPLIRDHLENKGYSTPLLRKDFIIHPHQVWQSRAIGADAMLLIMAALSDEQFCELLQTGFNTDLDILVEVHNSQELQRAIKCIRLENKESTSKSRIILGINNRDLASFKTDLKVSEKLAAELKEIFAQASELTENKILATIPIVSESGIKTRKDIDQLMAHSIRAFLIGESLVIKGSPKENLEKLLAKNSR
ncbi:UNVERIFIED_CONTAM: hypothetical protein GTU68_024331 [Idotea baltica]|nr:hypothetical protein [Idotea baltica]